MGIVKTQVELEGEPYVISSDLVLAVKVARATERPLLLFGEPGSGKSSLAKYLAWKEGLRYYEHVITARTAAKDLLWSFDSVRRLGDAQTGKLDDRDYVRPGVLWWAFDQKGARGFPRAREPFGDWNSGHADSGVVMLLDEIDKADPDLPNSLLVPLAGRYFTVTDLEDSRRVADKGVPPCLVVITSNEERDLPPAFERRCVVYRLDSHDETARVASLRDITKRHVGTLEGYPFVHLVEELLEARRSAGEDHRRKPSTAEFLDAVRACRGHGVEDDKHEDLSGIIKMIFRKNVRDGAARDW